MAAFTVRVELRYADSEDYDRLHEAMGEQGFTRTINGNGGKTVQLPDAEYNLIGDYTRSAVLKKTKMAAETTGLEYGILVTESNGRSWFGLKPAVASRR